MFCYILDKNHNPVEEPNLQEFARWFEELENRHGFNEAGVPLLFETMVFRGGEGKELARYATWEEAKELHRQIVEHVRANLGLPKQEPKKLRRFIDLGGAGA